MTSFIIGQFDGDKLIYKGHVTLGAYLRALNQHRYVIRNSSPFVIHHRGMRMQLG